MVNEMEGQIMIGKYYRTAITHDIVIRTDDYIRHRLAEYLPDLRILAGWSQEHLANMLGMTRGSIVNIEKKEELSVVNYLAILCLLNCEIDGNDNSMLGFALDMLVWDDNPPRSVFNDICDAIDEAKDLSNPRATMKSIKKLASSLVGKVYLRYMTEMEEKENGGTN